MEPVFSEYSVGSDQLAQRLGLSTPNRWALSADEEQNVLDFDPWGERDATYRVLRQGFCVVRASHECAICFGAIVSGERVWSRTEADDGTVKTFRFCPECCWCIAHRDDDGDDVDSWERMYDRWEVGRRRAAEAEREP